VFAGLTVTSQASRRREHSAAIPSAFEAHANENNDKYENTNEYHGLFILFTVDVIDFEVGYFRPRQTRLQDPLEVSNLVEYNAGSKNLCK
jgi:hypothetical protein